MRKLLALLVVAIVPGVTPIASADPATDKLRATGVIAYLDRDYAKAWGILRPLAEQGDVPAQEWLGTLYDKGAGVPRDYIRAYMWKNIAAASTPHKSTFIDKATYIKIRDDIAKKMTPAQIKRAEEITRACQASKFKQCN